MTLKPRPTDMIWQQHMLTPVDRGRRWIRMTKACCSPGDTARRQLDTFTNAQWETLSSRKLICIDWQTGTVLLLLFNWVECLLVCNSLANSSRQGRMWAGKGWVPRKVENMEESCEPPVVKNIHLDLFHVCYLKTMQCGSRGRLKVIKANHASLLETSYKKRFVGWNTQGKEKEKASYLLDGRVEGSELADDAGVVHRHPEAPCSLLVRRPNNWKRLQR